MAAAREYRGGSAALFVAALLLGVGGCKPKIEESAARDAITAAFTAANPAGRTGMELAGKAVWLEAPIFDKPCLEQNDLAFNDDPARRPSGTPARISPTYAAQRWITASTPTGYCVYMGVDPSLTVQALTPEKDGYKATVALGMKEPTNWFKCVDPANLTREVSVVADAEGKLSVEGDLKLFAGACPSPLPGGEERGATSRPSAKPPGAPSMDEVAALANALDKALYDGDYVAALAKTQCYNLFEKPPFGACSAGELVAVGPAMQGPPRAQDGTPWLEYAASSADAFGKIVRDGGDPTMFHVLLKGGGKERSFAVQWVDGEWKMVGVIGRKAEALTAVRYLYDLHRPDRRKVFERRLAGEELDEKGESTKKEDEEAGG